MGDPAPQQASRSATGRLIIPKATPTVFINYRREDSQWAARAIYEKLRPRLGPAHVFMDVDIPLGRDWRAEIRERVESCDAMLVVIGERWLSERIYDDDPFREEIEAGLARSQTLVIPLLVDGATLPAQSALPESIHPLLDCQAHSIPIGYFDAGVDRLIEGLLRAYGIHPDDPTEFQIKQAQAGEPSTHSEVQAPNRTVTTPPQEGLVESRDSFGPQTPVIQLPPAQTPILLPSSFAPEPSRSGSKPSRRTLWLSIGGAAAVLVAAIAIYLAVKPGPTPKQIASVSGQMAIPGPVSKAPSIFVPTGLALVGPVNGSLQQLAGKVELSTENASAENFEASATFTNPTDTSSAWDYGFLFRDSGSRGSDDVSDYRLWVGSDKKWHLTYGTSLTNISHGGPITGLRLGPGEQNNLAMTVYQGSGNFFVNGVFQGSINVSAHQVKGFIQAGTGFVTLDSKTGRTINYTAFTVMPSRVTYASIGTLKPYRPHDATKGPYVWFATNCTKLLCAKAPFLTLETYLASANFQSPTSGKSWDYGFFLRSTATNHQYAVTVNSNGKVQGFLDTGMLKNGLAEAKSLWSTTAPSLNLGHGDLNEVVVYVVDDVATLWINKTFVHEWPVTAITRPGWIMLTSNTMSKNEGATPVSFTNFVVISFDS